jgi:hypothetical protein
MNEEVKTDTVKEMKSNLGGSSNVCLSFDTTGSMQPCIQQVRQKLRDLVESMTADLPGIKIGLIAHGDYCDGDNCIRSLDLTDNLERIMKFINEAPNTGGGDAPECYEFALQTAKNMSWPKEGGSVILIGDDQPHEVNPNNINWRHEVKEMLEKNIKVFPMQCLHRKSNDPVNNFWEEISQISGTPLLMLESFNDSANTLEAVAYASAGVESFNFYKAKFSTEVAGGVRMRASCNLADMQNKLEDYAVNAVNIKPKDTVTADDNVEG